MATDLVREIQKHISTGRALLDSKKPSDAVKEFEEAQKLAQSVESPRTELLSTLFLITALYKVGNRLEISETVFEVQSQIKRIVNFPPAFVPFLNNIASELYQNQPDDAVILWENALKLARTLDKAEWENIILNNLAYGYHKQGQSQKAIETFLKTSELMEGIEAQENLENAAAIFEQGEEYEKALELMEKAAEQYKELNNEEKRIRSLQIAGELAYKLYSKSEDLDLASKYLQTAIRFFRQADDKFQLSNVLYVAGIYYQDSQREDMALECWRMAQEYALESKNIDVATKSLIKLALVDLSGEKFEQSLERLRNAQKLAQENEDTQTYESLTRLIDTVIQKTPEIASSEKEELETALTGVEGTQAEPSQLTATTEPRSVTDGIDESVFSFDFPEVEKEEAAPAQLVTAEVTPTPESAAPPPTVRRPQVESTLESTIDEARVDITGLLNQKRNEVANYLRSKGYSVEVQFRTSGMPSEITPDIVAKKRRRKIFLVFASNPADAGISSFLLRSVHERGRKIIFLLTGEPVLVQTARDIKVINQVEMLPT